MLDEQIQRQLAALADLAGGGPDVSQTLALLTKTQNQIAQTLQQVSSLAVQVHQDLAELEKRVAQLEAKPAAPVEEPKRGRRGRGKKRRK